jgi:hypothetical protein
VRIAGNTTDGAITLRGEPNAATMPVITSNQNTEIFLVNVNYFALRDADFRNTNITKTASYVIRVNTSAVTGVSVSGIIANDAAENFYRAIGIGGPAMTVKRCSIGNCEDVGIASVQTGGGWLIAENSIFSCGSHGIQTSGNNFGVNIVRNIIRGNTGDGINFTGGTDGRDSGLFSDNVFFDNGGSGIEIASTTIALPNITNNIFSENGDRGIRSAAGGNQDAMSQIIDGNAYYNNTSGTTTGVTVETNAIELTSDPFEDTTTNNFNINNDAGGGADLRAATVVLP